MAYKTTSIYVFSDFLKFCGKKLRTLIVPLLAWSLIANRYFFAKNFSDLNIEQLWNIFYQRDLWFLKYLFVISVLYGLFHLIQIKWNEKVVIWKDFVTSATIFFLLLGCSLFLLPSMFKSLALFFFFFMIGVLVSKHNFIEMLWNKSLTYAISVFVFCILSTHWNSDGKTLDDLIKVIVAPCSFVILNSLCKRFEKLPVSKLVSWIGRYSLIIYCSHWALLDIALGQEWEISSLNSFWLFGLCALIAIPICTGCILFAKVIGQNSVLAFLFMGKKLTK